MTTSKWTKEPEVGDVVMWRSDEMFMLTRVYGRAGEGFDLLCIDNGKDNLHVIQHNKLDKKYSYTTEQIKEVSTYICSLTNLHKAVEKTWIKKKKS